MTRMKELQHLYCVVKTQEKQYLSFTEVDHDTLKISVTDGYGLWRCQLGQLELDDESKSAKIDKENLLERIKNSFDSSANQLLVNEGSCTLIINKAEKMNFLLLKVDETEAKAALCDMLFFLAQKSKSQEEQLQKATTSIDNFKQKKFTMFDLNDAKSGKAAPKLPPKQPGMSVINPGSKKKKLAKGVEFD